MTVYPFAIDSDSEILRCDDNITEIGSTIINQLRDAVFAIENALGIQPSGSLSSVADFLGVSFNLDGTIKYSALTSIGLATLPIVDNQVALNAGIKESKLSLDYNTSDLHTLIVSNGAVLTNLASFSATTNANLLTHIHGGTLLADGLTLARHVASHIDINSVPSDTRDPAFVWTGLLDKSGTLRSATTVASALLQVNNDLTTHENTTALAHPATAITVDTSSFAEIPLEANTVQKALAALDDSDRLEIGDHRATMHTNGIPSHARSEQIGIDGYSQNIIPPTLIQAFLVHTPATQPVDSNIQGDDIVKFLPTNTGFVFDSQFAQVRIGDMITINYGNGATATFNVESKRFIPNTDWTIRINGKNVYDTDGYDGYARIDRPLFDENTYGILAVAAANNDINSSIIGSLIVGTPRGATALGFDFNPNQIDGFHYNLYLQLFPTGNPSDKIISLPAIDVSGNAGTTPGQYTIDTVVDATNSAFRASGFNYRFIAFSNGGEFGVMLADAINGASFSIVNGSISGASLITGAFINNVIADAGNGFDALGLGANKANIASPSFTSAYANTTAAASLPTNIIVPLRKRNFIANGLRRDVFDATFMANSDGYWPATIYTRTVVGTSTIETTYTVPFNLASAGLQPGKTIVVQPTVAFSDPLYQDADYGRFIIKSVSFTEPCDTASSIAYITVINAVHATGNPIGYSSSPSLAVQIYFSSDSVSFNADNITDSSPGGTVFNRYHEVYINEDGHTFTHERCRLPDQVESSTLLTINSRWSITDVSPKLRGFKDTGSTAFNKYIRFYILNYNSTNGTFDGYIGMRGTSTNISRTGTITTARKNIPTRFYDETNIDYIELQFFDETTSGVDPLSSNAPRYVDIEMFDSLELDDEFFLIASCNLYNNSVRTVKDKREFGSISEVDFTQSAIDFITAGEKYLHSNGVINGCEFVGSNILDSHLLTFNGGLVLVDGAIVAVNSGNAAIPEIYISTGSKPQTVDWAICINKSGDYQPIIITAAEQQFFAKDNISGNDYYVPSVIFSELINTRKDLTVIAIANITINSFTVNSVSDARRFVANETLNIPFTWTTTPIRKNLEDYNIGNFHSLDALKTWVNFYGTINNTVKIKGGQLITSTLDFTGFNFPVTFEGENAEFAITADKGISLGSNITLRGITFIYSPTNTFSSSDLINTGKSALYINVGSTQVIENVIIEKCVFADAGSGRPSHINVEMTGGSTLINFTVDDCIFADSVAAEYQAAISIINTNGTGGDTYAAVIINCNITDNYCNRAQGIYITSESNSSLNYVEPGIQAIGINITGNQCGAIGYLINSTLQLGSYFYTGAGTGKAGNYTINIENNNCILITNATSKGYVLGSDTVSGSIVAATSNSNIRNNSCNWILLANIRTDTGKEESSLRIIENDLYANSESAVLEKYNAGGGAAITTNTAISVGLVGLTSYNSDFGNQVHILNNRITSSNIIISAPTTVSFYYDIGIFTNQGAIIDGNIIDGVAGFYGPSGGVGIRIIDGLGTSYNVTNNQIFRREKTLNSYINIGSSVDGYGVITGNIFDHPTVDGTNEATILFNTPYTPVYWIVDRNVNQTGYITLTPAMGNFSAGQTLRVLAGDADGSGISVYMLPSFPTEFAANYNTSSASGLTMYFTWDIDLSQVIPQGASLIYGQVDTYATVATTSDSGIVINITADNIVLLATGSSTSFITPYVADTVSTVSAGNTNSGAPQLPYRNGVQNSAIRFILGGSIHSSSDTTVVIENMFLKYRW